MPAWRIEGQTCIINNFKKLAFHSSRGENGWAERKPLKTWSGRRDSNPRNQLGNKSDGRVYNNLASLARFTDSPQVSPYQHFPL